MANSRRAVIYEFEGFRLDAAHLLLYQNERQISLAPKVVETLLALVERHGEVLSRDELMEIVWADSIVEENNLSQNLYLLRKILGAGEDGKPLIETLRRRGYRFNGDVLCVEPKAAENFSPDKNQSAAPKITTTGHHFNIERRGNVPALADWKTDERSAPENGDYHSQISESAGHQNHWSIAVLPFVNISKDAENEYFCDGLAEELLNALAKIERLKVAARTSSFSFKNKSVGIGEIGRALNVGTVLEGSVRKIGDRLRITVQLIEVETGYHLWSESYDREMKDIFDVQDEITLAIVDALKVKLPGAEKTAVLKRYTDNVEVYELYLKGRFCLNSDFLNASSQNELQKAIKFFREAVSLDQNYAPAFAGLADAYTRLSNSGDAPPIETMPKAREAAQKALSLDNDLPEAHAALGIVLCVFDYDFAGAERECKLAVELNPNYAAARERYAGLLAALGRHDEADAEYRRALEIDPLSFSAKMKYCQFLFLARRYDESLVRLKKILELNPNLPIAQMVLAVNYEAQGKYAEAIEEMAKCQEMVGLPEHAVLIRESFAKGGWQGFLKTRMDFVSQQPNIPSTALASLYAGVGEKDKAFAELDKAYENHESGLANLKVEPGFDPLRNDLRFQNLLRRMKLISQPNNQAKTDTPISKAEIFE